jgi:hypothetical protein
MKKFLRLTGRVSGLGESKIWPCQEPDRLLKKTSSLFFTNFLHFDFFHIDDSKQIGTQVQNIIFSNCFVIVLVQATIDVESHCFDVHV